MWKKLDKNEKKMYSIFKYDRNYDLKSYSWNESQQNRFAIFLFYE